MCICVHPFSLAGSLAKLFLGRADFCWLVHRRNCLNHLLAIAIRSTNSMVSQALFEQLVRRQVRKT